MDREGQAKLLLVLPVAYMAMHEVNMDFFWNQQNTVGFFCLDFVW